MYNGSMKKTPFVLVFIAVFATTFFAINKFAPVFFASSTNPNQTREIAPTKSETATALTILSDATKNTDSSKEKLNPLSASSTNIAQKNTFDPIINISPEKIIQGDPIMISVKNATVAEIQKIYFDGKSLWFFNYQKTPTAFYGFDINQKPGQYVIELKMEDGREIDKKIEIVERPKIEKPLGIPEKLGGNTPEAATALVTNLSKENLLINNVWSVKKLFWQNKFQYPLANIVVTDPYGYSRDTVGYTITHKGADFRASVGTSVLAINGGIVRLAKQFEIYGNTIAIDHGFGIVSYYMHLSKLSVIEGQSVIRGQTIGLSGMTGYAESPHLHLSVKIDGVSIDPIEFLNFFK